MGISCRWWVLGLVAALGCSGRNNPGDDDDDSGGDGDADADGDGDGDGDADADADGDFVPCRESPAWQHASVAAPGDGWGVDVAAGPDDALHVTWTDSNGGGLLYASETDGWAAHVVDTDADPQRGSIALDAAGTPHIVYFAQEVRDLRHAWRPGADPAVWQIEDVDTQGDTGWSPDLAFDASGRAHVIYGSTQLGLRYALLDGGWQFEDVDPDASGPDGGHVALDPAGAPSAAYRTWDGSVGRLRVATREAGGTWTVESLDTPASVREPPPIAFGPEDLYLAPLELESGALSLLSKRDTGWTTEPIDPGEAGSPALAVGADGVIHLAYSWWNGHDARYARRDADGWQLETIASAGDAGDMLALTLDGAGHVAVAFVSYGGAAADRLRVATRATDGDVGPSPTCAPDPAEE